MTGVGEADVAVLSFLTGRVTGLVWRVTNGSLGCLGPTCAAAVLIWHVMRGCCRADAELSLLRNTVERVVLELLTGASSSAAVKRSLLANVVSSIAATVCGRARVCLSWSRVHAPYALSSQPILSSSGGLAGL